jgi:cytoplasmic iron level regulating protein YaaA (DUF328/UPF0246 family)
MKIALLSCTQRKQTYPCMAQDMYVPSQLFRKAKEYVLKNEYDAWFILSAKYGLLQPNTLIEPYNVSIMDLKKDEIVKWSERITKQLLEYPVTQVDVFAGSKYRQYLLPLLEKCNIVFRVPLKGLGIGQQLKYFKEFAN